MKISHIVSSVAQSCLTLWDPMNRSMPGLPVHHHLQVYSNSCPSSRWCHPAISSSVVPFSSCPWSLPASGSFPKSQLFAWGGQSIGVSASAAYTIGPSNSLHTQQKCIHMYQNYIPENAPCCTIFNSQKLETTPNFSISRKATCTYLISRKMTCMHHDTCMQLYEGVKKWVNYNYMPQHGWISHTYCTIACA